MIGDPLAPSAVWGGSDLHWSEAVVTPPPCEPVSLTQIKHRLRIVHDGDNSDLLLLISAARRQVEIDTSAVLVSATIDQVVDAPPPSASVLKLVRWPVQSVVSVTATATDGTVTVLDPASYIVDTASRPVRLILTPSSSWPAMRTQNALAVRMACGFAASPLLTVTSVTWAAGVATVTVQGTSGTLLAGDQLSLRGADQEFYNNTFTVLSTQGSTITLAAPQLPGWPDPPSPATGAIKAIELGTPETFQLAVMALVQHWWDPLRRGLTSEGTREIVLPFGYEMLTSDRLEWLA